MTCLSCQSTLELPTLGIFLKKQENFQWLKALELKVIGDLYLKEQISIDNKLTLLLIQQIFVEYLPCQLVQSLSCVWLFATPLTAACQDSLSITISQSLLKLMSIESVMPSKHLILCHPLLLLPSVFPSIRVFSNESILHIWRPKYWSFSFSISPSNEHTGLISFRMDWFVLLAGPGTLKSLLATQFKSINSSALSLLYGPTLLRPHGLQHTKLPSPSPSPWVCSNSCPLSWWCHPTISSSVAPFFSSPQS